ncbi:MAG: hypothetical protein LBG04_02015 [Holosporaceae bacterium]|jgi:hypothetical protein|nr:hypothetical protein [Holosporaceae bacterium]
MESMESTAECLKQEVFIPIRIIKRGSVKTKIITPDNAFPSLNQPLVRALLKAHKWELEIAKIGDIDIYCRQNKLSKRYLQRILRLNNLSPRIKKAILDGTFPPTILLQDLVTKPMDLLWHEQNAQIFGDA